MRALIPAAGRGTRLRPQTNTKPKSLLRVADKPIIGHILDNLKTTQIKEVIVILGYMKEPIAEYLQKNYSNRFKFIFVEQEPRLGLGHAVYVAKEQAIDQPLMILLGDMIFLQTYKDMLQKHNKNGECEASIGVKEVDQPQNYGNVKIKNGKITKLVEKPSKPLSNLAISGVYIINDTPLLYKALEEIMKKGVQTKEEYQLTDALQKMIDWKSHLKTFKVEKWYDCGRKNTLLEANRIILQEKHKNHTKLTHSQPANTIIIPPVAIAEECRIENSVLGPYVSVAENATIKNSIIKNTIIGTHAQIENTNLTNTLIGDEAIVKGTLLELNVGDHASIHLTY
ncbi:MAG: sugar nucleotidyltransferase [Candidatus Jordarchaeum sp.]|uniref:sugar nucleotidyltransferase n=1 Tax=Candidatus Jordarchaeum sp. TaxID=2823881 RepID=UPI00404A4925